MTKEDYKIAYENVMRANKMLEQEIERLTNELNQCMIDHNKLLDRIDKAIEYIEKNCILSDTWKDLDFCNFVPIGEIKYKALSSKKVKNLLDILNGVNKPRKGEVMSLEELESYEPKNIIEEEYYDEMWR